MPTCAPLQARVVLLTVTLNGGTVGSITHVWQLSAITEVNPLGGEPKLAHEWEPKYIGNTLFLLKPI